MHRLPIMELESVEFVIVNIFLVPEFNFLVLKVQYKTFQERQKKGFVQYATTNLLNQIFNAQELHREQCITEI